MKKFIMFLSVVAVLIGFSSCKKTCKCYMGSGRNTTNLGKFKNFTKKQCKEKENTLDERYNRGGGYGYGYGGYGYGYGGYSSNSEVTCTLE